MNRRVHGGMALEPTQPKLRDVAAVEFLRLVAGRYLRGAANIGDLETAIAEARHALASRRTERPCTCGQWQTNGNAPHSSTCPCY